LVESGTYGSSIPLDAYRGTTLCLRVRSLGEAAALEIDARPSFYSRQKPRIAPLVSLSS
jgi:hypothetical protein